MVTVNHSATSGCGWNNWFRRMVRPDMDNDCQLPLPPSCETILKWGYGEDLEFIEQDEDLLLADVQYMPALLVLAMDDRCPKQHYAISILRQITNWILSSRDKRGTGAAASAWIMSTELTNQEVHSWASEFLEGFSRIAAPKPFAAGVAEVFAKSLIGSGKREVGKTGRRVAGCTEFQSRAVSSTFACYLYVDEKSGEWQYWQNADVDPDTGGIYYKPIEESKLAQLLGR